MSDSSSEGSFLLEELGLNNGAKKDKDKPKKKPKPKAKKKQNPNRKPLSLDEIMKSMGIDTPNETTPTTTPVNDLNLEAKPKEDSFNLFPSQSQAQNKEPQLQFIQAPPVEPQVNLSIFESRIVDYLNRSLKAIVDEFSIELTQLFQFNNQMDDVISSFLDSIKQTIREEINFLVEPKSSLLVCFDSFAPEFRGTYLEIEKMKNLSIPKRVAEIRNAAASISSYIPSINSRFAHSEVTNELNELNSVRLQYKRAKKKLYQLKRNLFLTRTELECKSQTQRMEANILQSKMQHLENERSKLDLFEDNTNQSTTLDQTRKLHKLVHYLSSYSKKRKELKPKWHLQEIKDIRNEINYYRQINNYQNDLFETKSKELVNQQMSILLSRSMPFQVTNNNSTLLPQQSLIFTPNSLIQPQIPLIQQSQLQQIQQSQPQISNNNDKRSKHRKKSPKVTEISRSDLTGHELINHVQEQLRKAQESNQSSLDTTTHYLSNLKKKERKRARQYVTQLIDSEYDMNSLFSLT